MRVPKTFHEARFACNRSSTKKTKGVNFSSIPRKQTGVFHPEGGVKERSGSLKEIGGEVVEEVMTKDRGKVKRIREKNS